MTTVPEWDGDVVRAVDLDLDVLEHLDGTVVCRRPGRVRRAPRRLRLPPRDRRPGHGHAGRGPQPRCARRTRPSTAPPRRGSRCSPGCCHADRVRIDFHGSDEPTLGVEWEFALVDRRTRDLRNDAEHLFARAKARLPDPARLHKELLQEHRRDRHRRSARTRRRRRWPTCAGPSRSSCRPGTTSGSTCTAPGRTPSRRGPRQAADRGSPLRGADQPHPVVGPADADLGRARARRHAGRSSG